MNKIRIMPGAKVSAWALVLFCWITCACASDEVSVTQIVPQVPTWQVDPKALHSPGSPAASVLEGVFSLASDVKSIGLVKCRFLIPMGRNGLPLSTSPDIVMRFGWIGQFPLGKDDPARQLSEKYGFTTLAIEWPRQPGISDSDAMGFSLFPESGSGATWLRAVNCVQILGQLPQRRLFCIGYSAGGSASHLFAEWANERVGAYVSMGGRTFQEHPKFSGPVLLLRSERDRTDPNQALESALKERDYPALHLTFPPNWRARGSSDGWAHNASGAAWNFSFSWLAALANQRIRNSQEFLPYKQWEKREDIRLPAADCFDLLAHIPCPPDVVRDPSSDSVSVVGRSLLSDSKNSGSILWIDRSPFTEAEEMIAFVELFNELGYASGAVSARGDVTHLGDAVQKLRNVKKWMTPNFLAVNEPAASDLGHVAQNLGKFSKVLIINPRCSLDALQKGNLISHGKVRILYRPRTLSINSSSSESDPIPQLPPALRNVRLWRQVKKPGER
jgi:pimeloyl-ACP methyl ester carboxylesterase